MSCSRLDKFFLLYVTVCNKYVGLPFAYSGPPWRHDDHQVNCSTSVDTP